MGLTIWSNGVVIHKSDSPSVAIEAGQAAQLRFDTCAHKSDKEETYIHRTCCQTNTLKGYMCRAKDIKNVMKENCAGCDRYVDKTAQK